MRLYQVLLFLMVIALLSTNCWAMTNPAAAYCNMLNKDFGGYEYKINTNNDGSEYGVCITPDRNEYGEWAFFEGKVGQNYSYCAQMGYGIETVKSNSFVSEEAVCLVPTAAQNSLMQNLVGSDITGFLIFQPNFSLAGILAKAFFGDSQDIEINEVRVIDLMNLTSILNDVSISNDASASKKLVSESSAGIPQSEDLPSYFSWRNVSDANWISPVKNQGSCGSCWAFGAIGAIEADYNIEQNNSRLNPDLSEQYLVSEGSSGNCAGGWPGTALYYTQTNGIPDETCLPYIDANGDINNRCSDYSSRLWNINSYGLVSDANVKQSLISNGPHVVYMYISGWDSVTYTCQTLSGAHAPLLVGYNDTEGVWILKNSWGSTWNGDGFFKVKYGNCSIEQYIMVGIVNPPNFKPVVTINSPGNYTMQNSSEVVLFNFTSITKISASSTCDLIVNGVVKNTTTANNATATAMSYNLTQKNYNWNITCWESNLGIIGTSGTGIIGTPPLEINITNPESKIYTGDPITLNVTTNRTATCVYSLNNGPNYGMTANSTGTGFNASISQIADGDYNITYQCNDTFGNIRTATINFSLDTTGPIFISSLRDISSSRGLAYNINAIDVHGVRCFGVNDSRFVINCTGYLRNSVVLNSGTYTLNITANDTLNNTNSSIVSITVLETNQEYATNETVAIAENITEIVIDTAVNVSQIIIPANISSNATINLSFVQILTAGNASIGTNLTLSRQATDANYSLMIPASTNVNGGPSWDGKIIMPIVNDSNFTISSGSVNLVIDVGALIELNSSRAMKISFGRMAEKKAAWSRNDNSLITISTVCNNAANPTNINSVSPRECYIGSDNDLLIWTYHLTSFAVYTPITQATSTTTTATTTANNGGGGGSRSIQTTTIVSTTSIRTTAVSTTTLITTSITSTIISRMTEYQTQEKNKNNIIVIVILSVFLIGLAYLISRFPFIERKKQVHRRKKR